MTSPEPSVSDRVFMERTVEAAIRIGVIAGLIAWCFMIARPFLVPIIWGAIIAIAVFHGYERLQTGLGGRRITAAVLITLLMLVLLVVPSVLLGDSLVSGARMPKTPSRVENSTFRRRRTASLAGRSLASPSPKPGHSHPQIWRRRCAKLVLYLKVSGAGSWVPLREPDLGSCSSCWRFSFPELFSPILGPQAA